MSVKCAYHSENDASDKCERCNRNICLKGKRVYHKRHSRGTGSHRTTYSTRHIYCPPCQADVATNDATGPGAIVGNIFFLIIGSIVTLVFFAVAGPLGIFPLLIIGIGIYQMIQRGKKADEARQDERDFLNSLEKEIDGVNKTSDYNRFKSYSRPDKAWSLSEVHCSNCGNKLGIESKYCIHCGDPTTEEREVLQNK